MLKKNYKVFILLGIISLLFENCGTVKKAFDPERKNSSEEFFVEKKSPLSMPPNFDELAVPKKDDKSEEDLNKDIELLITENIEDDNQTTEIESSNKDFERLLLDRIKNN
jgi:hypothetical protein